MNILIRKVRWILVPILCLVVTGGAGAYWFLLRDTSASKLALRADASVPGVSGTDLSGEWTVVPGVGEEATTAGYRVQEKVAGGVVKTTATGRTTDVTGSVTVVGQRVTAAYFTVNMTALKSDKSLRDSVLETLGIQTKKYPSAAFTLTNPVTLPAIATGEISTVEARGTLELHGVSNPVTVTLHYKPTQTGFVVLADMPIKMARAETPTHYIMMGLDVELNLAMRMAITQTIDFLKEKKGLEFLDGLALASVGVDFEVTQVVDTTKGIHAMIPKSIFKDESATTYWYHPESEVRVVAR